MSAYLTFKTKTGETIFSMSRNTDTVQYILENYSIAYNQDTELEDISLAIEDVSEYIRKTENRINAMLIKRDFDEIDYVETKEFLVELYEIRGRLYLINSILGDGVYFICG